MPFDHTFLFAKGLGQRSPWCGGQTSALHPLSHPDLAQGPKVPSAILMVPHGVGRGPIAVCPAASSPDVGDGSLSLGPSGLQVQKTSQGRAPGWMPGLMQSSPAFCLTRLWVITPQGTSPLRTKPRKYEDHRWAQACGVCSYSV